MNKLVIIGNGFDLAHGLKTKYSDFILWYLNSVLKKGTTGHRYNDNLVEVYTVDSNPFMFRNIQPMTTISEVKNFIKNNPEIKIKYKHDFFRQLINELTETNWVDIEYKYYNFLTAIYHLYENRQLDQSSLEKEIQGLNNCFSVIKNELENYLSEISIDHGIIDNEIEAKIKNLYSEIENDETIYFLNFNYTSTIEHYTKKLDPFDTTRFHINYIHGKLGDEKNPIIFGYGDEMDLYYEKIERSNSKESLKYFKSFSYLKTKNYQHLSSFINSNLYEVHIIGHSCGLSDRILLNSVFELKKCQKIHISYHEKDALTNDYFDKTIEISRHFKSEGKHRMRNIIATEEESQPLKRFRP